MKTISIAAVAALVVGSPAFAATTLQLTSAGTLIYAGAAINQYPANSADVVPTKSLPNSAAGLPSSIGALPEPTSWALMLAGFAATGVAVRRRARPHSVAA